MSNPLDRLYTAGLRVYPMHPDSFPAWAKLLQEDPHLAFIHYCTIEKSSQASEDTDEQENTVRPPERLTIAWSIEQNKWITFRIRGHGMLAPDDISYESTSFDIIITVIEQYYFGVSTIVYGWEVPLHRHPELDVAQVQIALTKAETVSVPIFHAIRKKYREDAVRTTSEMVGILHLQLHSSSFGTSRICIAYACCYVTRP